jgi:hypothetical protein
MINVSLKYMGKTDFEKVDWEVLRQNWPGKLADEKPETCPWYGEDPHRLTYDEANAIAASGAQVELVPLPGAMLTKMQNDPAKHWEFGSRIEPLDLISGAAVQISVPDMALMYIDEVELETDFCTDALQDKLDEGWRILAICPPNSQRRPDYILGRRKGKDPFDGR